MRPGDHASFLETHGNYVRLGRSGTTGPRRPGSAVVGSAVIGSAVAGSAVVDSAVASFPGAGSAAASSSGAGTDGATLTASRLLFSGLPLEVSSSPVVVVTPHFRILIVPATALSSRRLFSRCLQHRRHTSAYVYQSIQSTVFPQYLYNGVFKNQNKNATATRIGRYVHFPPLVSIARASVLGPRHRRMQQPVSAMGSHNL